MKKFLSLFLVSVMLVCMVPAMGLASSAANYDTIPTDAVDPFGAIWTRLGEYTVNLNGGTVNGLSATLGIPEGFTGSFTLRIYNGGYSTNNPGAYPTANDTMGNYLVVAYINGVAQRQNTLQAWSIVMNQLVHLTVNEGKRLGYVFLGTDTLDISSESALNSTVIKPSMVNGTKGEINFLWLDNNVTYDEIPGFGYQLKRASVLEVTIPEISGIAYNANSGVKVNGIAANKLGIPNGYQGSFRIHVYKPDLFNNEILENLTMNSYIGVIYGEDGEVWSESFYAVGDLLNVIGQSVQRNNTPCYGFGFKYDLSYITPDGAAEEIFDRSFLQGTDEVYPMPVVWKHTLTFDTNGGVMPKGYEKSYDFYVHDGSERFVDVIGGFPVPTMDGYEFTGWRNTAYTPDFWTEGWGTQPYTYNQDITLKAEWTEAKEPEYEITPADPARTPEDVMADPKDGDKVVVLKDDHDYYYVYHEDPMLGASAGWYVTVKSDRLDKTVYGEFYSELFGKDVTVMYKTYDGCTSMTDAPAIPDSIDVMYNCYKGTAITASPVIPEGVHTVYGAYKNSDIETMPEIPEGVTNLTYAFSNCDSLTEITDLPDGAVITGAFQNCDNLAGEAEITSNSNEDAYKNTQITSVNVNEGVTVIENGCFSKCTKVSDVTYGGTAEEWANKKVGSCNEVLNVKTLTCLGDKAPVAFVKGNKTYISGLCDIKDFFVANGTQTTYREVANNKLFSFTSARLDGDDNVFVYGAALSGGDYTLYVRYTDGSYSLVNFTVA